MKKILIPLAEGCEEMEAVIIIDTLRRAGWEVVSAGFTDGPITASRGVRLVADMLWDQVDPVTFDYFILPGGGGGVQNLMNHEGVLEAIRAFDRRSGNIAAICAAPLVLQRAGILKSRVITSYPSVAEELSESSYRDDKVVTDGNLVTSRGPGTAMAFALALVAREQGEARAQEIAAEMVAAD